MKDIYIIYGKGPCGKSWFIQNIVYDENIDKLVYYNLNEFDFLLKGKSELADYKNVIVDEFNCHSNLECRKLFNVVSKYEANFDNLFIIAHEYTDYIREEFCRPIARFISNKKDIGQRIHILDFDSGQNFNIRNYGS